MHASILGSTILQAIDGKLYAPIIGAHDEPKPRIILVCMDKGDPDTIAYPVTNWSALCSALYDEGNMDRVRPGSVYLPDGTLVGDIVGCGFNPTDWVEAQVKAEAKRGPILPTPEQEARAEAIALSGHSLAIARAGRALAVSLICNLDYLPEAERAKAMERMKAWTDALEPVAPF